MTYATPGIPAGVASVSSHFAITPHQNEPLAEFGGTRGASKRNSLETGLELAKLARRKDGQEFDCATWLHKAREMPKEEFRREVEKELTGKDTEPSEIVYFKLYKSQIPVVEQATETAALMLGTDKSRGYCLEMMCADFLAGATLDGGDPEILLQSQQRFFSFLGREQQKKFLSEATAHHELSP